MTHIRNAVAENQRALAAFLDKARAVPEDRWDVPASPGRWSPAQIAEHVARGYEVSWEGLSGPQNRVLPSFLRPVVGGLFRGLAYVFSPIIRSGRFPWGLRAPAVLRPSETPGSEDEVLGRLERASDGFEADVVRAAEAGHVTMRHPLSGTVALATVLRFQAIHTDHHAQQLR